MADPDFRALCAELLQAMDEITEYEIVDWSGVKSKPLKMADKSMEEARAALASPEPQGPTDSELLQFLLDNLQSYSLHMDGTAEYSLNTRNWPFNHRASGRREFIEEAYRRYHSGR